MKKLFIYLVMFVILFPSALAENDEVSSRIEALLGDNSNFSAFEQALNSDTNNYTEQVKSMVFVLGNAFNTAQLGTKSAEIAIKALIPQSVYATAPDADSKMSAIYQYFTTGQISHYFTLSFTSAGDLYDVTIPLANVKAFVQDGINCNVFLGSFDFYDLNPQITTLDVFCEKMNITKEVAIAMLQYMESYDISWLDGDSSTLLDSFIP